MEKHQIIIDSITYEYNINFKRIKSIYIRVIDGQIIVNAPYLTPIHTIEKLIIEYQDKLKDKINQYEPYITYKNQGKVLIFDKQYTIKLLDIGEKRCAIHENQLYVYHCDLIKTIDLYLKETLLNYIQERMIYYLTYEFDLDMPHIQIKNYKGRWGSCFYKENRVTFNSSLVHLNKELIDYVIVHELSHFIEPNHSTRFYQEIEKRIPDYKSRIKKLKEKHT